MTPRGPLPWLGPALLLAAVAAGAEPPSGEAIVLLEGPDHHGGGIAVAARASLLYVATPLHVAEGADRLRLPGRAEALQPSLLLADARLDLALLAAPLPPGWTPPDWAALAPRAVARPGDSARALGHPGEERWHSAAAPARLEEVSRSRLLIGAPCPAGSSGGGVFDASGGLLGMLLRTGAADCEALPLARIRERVLREGLPFEIPSLAPEAQPPGIQLTLAGPGADALAQELLQRLAADPRRPGPARLRGTVTEAAVSDVSQRPPEFRAALGLELERLDPAAGPLRLTLYRTGTGPDPELARRAALAGIAEEISRWLR